MPTYVYKFIETGETIEIQQSFDDATLTEAVHPESGETMAVKKVFLPVGVTFKGDGFYKTDSRAKKTSSSSGSDTASSESSGSKPSGEGSSKESGSKGAKESGSGSTSSTSTPSSTTTSTSSD